jgi:hypothetical protein
VQVAEELGRENDAVAQPSVLGEEVAEDLLRMAVGVEPIPPSSPKFIAPRQKGLTLRPERPRPT